MSVIFQPAGTRQRGRTMLELLISMAVGLVVLGALMVIYLSTNASNRQSTAVSRMNEDAGIVMNLVGTQLRMAGFSLPRRQVAPGGAKVGNVLISVPDRNFIGAGIRGCDHGFVNLAAAFDSIACSAAATGSAAFAIRFEGVDPDDIASVKSLAPPREDCRGNEVTVDTVGALEGATYRLVESRYMVRVSTSNGTHELFCAGNGSAFNPYPIIQYVEGMHARYGVAKDALTREIDRLDATAADVDTLPGTPDQRWSRVVSVRLCILMRSAQPDPGGASSYLDCDGNPQPSAGGFARRAYSSVFTLRNRGGFSASAP